MSRIHDIPEEDRPRERLLRLGAGALSDAELLAIFINTGMKGENALQVAQRLLKEQGSLRNLSKIEASALVDMRGLGPAKAANLAAAFELGRRAEQQEARGASTERKPCPPTTWRCGGFSQNGNGRSDDNRHASADSDDTLHVIRATQLQPKLKV